jgi:hypothetical protein
MGSAGTVSLRGVGRGLLSFDSLAARTTLMILRPRFLLVAFLFVTAGVLASVSRASAAEPAKDPKNADRSIREQDIYIPYEKLRQVFEKNGRGVFLPYEKFQELWKAAQDKTPGTQEVKPPVGALITEIRNEATVEKDVVRVKAVLQIELLTEGWREIPLRLADAAITSATIGGQPAKILGSQGQDYRLLVEKKGAKSEQIELTLEYAKAIERSPGRNSVSFQTPQAPVSRWRVTIPQSGVKVDFSPLIAATEATAGKKPDETVVMAFVGAAPTVSIQWTPKAEGATGLAAMASVQAEQQVWINESVVRTRTTLNYAISRAELAQLVVDVPSDQKVANVFDANVRQWSVATVEGRQRITAQLFEPAKQSQRLTIELEKFTGDKSRQTVDVPVVRVAGIGLQQRQQGVVVVQVAEGLRAEAATTSGLLQVDARELPQGIARANWAFLYRYATPDYQLALNVEKVEPEIAVDSLVEASLEPERLTLDLTAVYTIEKAGVFRLELDVPTGYEVRKVQGVAARNAAPVQVDGFHLEGEKKSRLVVNLSRKAIGRAALSVQLQKDLQRPELLTPTGKTVEIASTIPVVAPKSVQRASGRLVVYAPESLRVNPGKLSGLRSISFQEALQDIKLPHSRRQANVRPVLAFAFTQEPVDLNLAAERRKPQVTVRQLLVARVEEGVVKYQFTFFYQVLYSGVKSLRIDVPADVAANLRVATPGVRERAISPPPADVGKKDVAWTLTGDSELFGDGKIELTCEEKITKLDIGKSVELSLPFLKPRDVDRAWGQIALAKSETIDVFESGEPKALRPIDPQHDLMTPVAAAARAFEFHDDWKLKVTATRYQLEEVKRTSIERAVVRMVVTPAKMVSVQALYRMRSVQQRLAVALPEGATFDSQPLRINGRSVMLEKGRENEFFIPLVGTNADRPFVLELRYTLPGDGSRLDLPTFPQEPAVVKAYLCVYLPETTVLLGIRGPWHEEKEIADAPIPWVQESVTVEAGSGDHFQRDGHQFIYSTLSPSQGIDGALQMTTCSRVLFDGVVFAGTILLGLLLLPARLPLRVLVVGLAIIALVLSGTFMPTFASRVLGGSLTPAVFIVAILWAIGFAMRLRACRSKVALPPVLAGEVTAATVEAKEPETTEGGADHE